MKLTFALIGCLVAIASGQSFHWYLPGYSPDADVVDSSSYRYHPYRLRQRPIPYYSPYQHLSDEDKPDLPSMQMNGRYVSPLLASSFEPEEQYQNGHPSDSLVAPLSFRNSDDRQRLFFSAFFSSTRPVTTLYVYTSTTNYTSTASFTTTCIPPSSFTVVAGVTASTPCGVSGRRRRALQDQLQQFDEDLDIAPSQIEPLVPTAVQELPAVERHIGAEEAAISSSQDSDQLTDPARRKRQFFFPRNTVISTVSTSTFFTLTTNFITVSGTSNYQCLPPGWQVCSAAATATG